MLTLSVHCVHVCCRIMFGWQRCDLWPVSAAQFSLCLVHAGGEQPGFACMKPQHVRGWPWCIQKCMIFWAHVSRITSLVWMFAPAGDNKANILWHTIKQSQTAQHVTCSFISQNFTDWFSVSERCDRLDILLEKGCGRGQLEFPVSKGQILQDRPLGKKTGNVNSTQISPQKMALKLRPGTQPGAFWFDDLPPEVVSSFSGRNKVLILFLRRQSGDFPGQDSTHGGLSCGHLLPDGPVGVHDRWSGDDQRPGLLSV